MTTTYNENPTDDLRSAAVVLRYAASMFLDAAHAAEDQNSMTAGRSILELLMQVAPEADQLRT